MSGKKGAVRKRIPVMQRILSRVEIVPGPLDTPCWVVARGFRHLGYARVTHGSLNDGTYRSEGAHRVVYQELVGPVPEGLTLDHLCFNTTCCNPDHLDPVTSAENTRRARARMRPTHCPKDHEYTSENTYEWGGRRNCRVCHRDRSRERMREVRRAIRV